MRPINKTIQKAIAFILATLFFNGTFAQATATEATVANWYNDEWKILLLGIAVTLLIVIILLTSILKALLQYKFKAPGASKSLLIAFGLSLLATAAQAQTEAAAPAADSFLTSGNTVFIATTAIIFIELLVVLLLLRVVFSLLNDKVAETQAAKTKLGFWERFNQGSFTKAVPIEREADVLLDHDYDGIKELDNSLPPWWVYGFYATIVFAIIYLVRFHVTGTAPLMAQEYQQQMDEAAAEKAEYIKKVGNLVDENNVTLADAAGIAEGKATYSSMCMPCHGANGEGSVGPNLTDNYWLHGGKINDIFKTIKYGVPAKGMKAWEQDLSPSQMKNVASYIKSLNGTKPANAKEPQGDLYQEETTPADTSKSTASANMN